MAASVHCLTFKPTRTEARFVTRNRCPKPFRCEKAVEKTGAKRRVTVRNGNDSLDICRVLNGMWQTSGGWGRIDRDVAVDAMLRYSDAGFSTFDMADIYGPSEDLYGIFINRVRRERSPELLDEVKGLTKWVPRPGKMTGSYVRENIDLSRKKMDVASLDMLQFHWNAANVIHARRIVKLLDGKHVQDP